jgi:transcriptional regulator with XRE-family HTH domain
MPDKSDVKALLAMNLRRARANKKLSQLALAEQIGMAATFINDIEHGRKWVSPATIKKLCDGLAILPYQLFVSEDSTIAKKDAAIAACCNEILSETSKAIQKVRDRYLG